MTEDELLLREAEKIAHAVGRMFPGLCEVVLHDLRDPAHAVRAIEGGLSGRAVGDPATELGLARIADPEFPDVLQNYPNRFPNGRPAKSTSIGIRNSGGEYVAALCLNLDVSLLGSAAHTLTRLAATGEPAPLTESLRARTSDELRAVVEDYATGRGHTPHSLPAAVKKDLVRSLKERGFLELKNAVPTLTDVLGISRASVYNYLR
ncbi:transcriptional regulator [Amycolatopsis sp. lyj-346]|uniref:helix-turn-helix transcriptional regulator n=1 Tax=Amycolatopsis sp. lyj-346 TaxID=2789289 RepID=UPI00397A633E